MTIGCVCRHRHGVGRSEICGMERRRVRTGCEGIDRRSGRRSLMVPWLVRESRQRRWRCELIVVKRWSSSSSSSSEGNLSSGSGGSRMRIRAIPRLGFRFVSSSSSDQLAEEPFDSLLLLFFFRSRFTRSTRLTSRQSPISFPQLGMSSDCRIRHAQSASTHSSRISIVRSLMVRISSLTSSTKSTDRRTRVASSVLILRQAEMHVHHTSRGIERQDGLVAV